MWIIRKDRVRLEKEKRILNLIRGDGSRTSERHEVKVGGYMRDGGVGVGYMHEKKKRGGKKGWKEEWQGGLKGLGGVWCGETVRWREGSVGCGEGKGYWLGGLYFLPNVMRGLRRG